MYQVVNKFLKLHTSVDVTLSFQKSRAIRSLSRQYAAPVKRFYREVSIAQNNDHYEINLDQRKLKTPLGKPFLLPNEALAVAVATEWDSQQKLLEKQAMHFTSLCNTVLDNPSGKCAKEIVCDVLEYLESDTLCYRVEENLELAKLQTERWDPILLWFQNRYNVKVNISEKLNVATVPVETKLTLERQLLAYDEWSLAGMIFTVENLKSLILSQALVERFIDVETSVSLSRLELEYQISHWGKVDWAHDVDLFELRARTSAGILFIHLCSQDSRIQKKLK